MKRKNLMKVGTKGGKLDNSESERRMDVATEDAIPRESSALSFQLIQS